MTINQAIPVKYHSFFDCGFDPRFSVDGKSFFQKKWTFGELQQNLKDVFWRAVFTFRAYCSTNTEEREIRQWILTCSKAEANWSNFNREAYVKDHWSNNITYVPYGEHDFLEKSSKLYHKLKPEFPSLRVFPSELLTPIHTINKPQAEHDLPDFILKQPLLDSFGNPIENADLSGLCTWGFARLSSDFISHHLNKSGLRYYVPHREYISATRSSSEELKKALREWRIVVAQNVIDRKCATSFEECKKNILSSLCKFKRSWDSYEQSHALLKEVGNVVHQKVFFEDYYKNLSFYSKIPNIFISFFDKFFVEKRYKKNEYYRDLGYKLLCKAFIKQAPQNLTGNLFREIQTSS